MAAPGTCRNCGHSIGIDESRCPACEHSSDAAASPKTGQLMGGVFPPSVVIAGIDPSTGFRTVKVHDPETTSEAHRSATSDVSFTVQGKPNVGRKGEKRLLKTLSQTLRAKGLGVTIQPGRDEYGEDGVLLCSDRTYTVQVVTSPADKTLWRQASRGARRSADSRGAIAWLHEAIAAKASKIPRAERLKTILALDVRHTGVLTDDAVLTQYISEHGHPSRSFDFAAVWVVGPTVDHCQRFGDGSP